MNSMNFIQAMLLAVLQGASELFPVSSLGHIVIVPALLHWNIDRKEPTFLAFVVVLHLGTAAALAVFYRRDWIAIIRAFVASIVRGRLSDDLAEKTAWLLLAGTIPVGLLGVFLQAPVRALFGSTAIVAIFLMLNGLLMFLGEHLKRIERPVGGVPPRALSALAWPDGVKVGFAQAFALLPGISRSGASMVAGLLLDLTHEDAARYSFLLATPVIGAASLLELPRLFEPAAHAVLVQSLAGGAVAGVTAYFSVAFLTRYFQTHDLRPFGWYCLGIGGISLALALAKAIS
jgi:undecaprenyl-diphosphatase